MRLIRSRSLALPLLLTAATLGVADAAIVFDGATVTATATTIGTGLNVNGVTKTRIDESTYTATLASSSTSGGTTMTQVSSPFAELPGGTAEADSHSFISQQFDALGRVTFQPDQEVRAYGVCDGARCATYSAIAEAETLISFTLDSEYAYRLSVTAETGSLPVEGTVETRGVLRSLATNSDIVSSNVLFDDASVCCSQSLVKTGTLAPGLYSLYFVTTSTVTRSSPDEAYLNGLGNSYLQLTAVPLPAAAWLVLSGLGGVAAVARRRRTPPPHSA